MKEKPIIFSSESIRAILEGRKTQSRRVIKPNKRTAWLLDPDIEWSDEYIKDPDNQLVAECPYGQVGDRLWVREKHCIECFKTDGIEDCCYYFDEAPPYDITDCDKVKWRPSIHMPRWASRITLEITGIRVERLQEITEEDVLAEGITVMRGTWQSKKWNEKTRKLELTGERHPYTGRYHFEVLWDSLNAKRGYSWESNPWVWGIEFKN